MTAAPGRWGWTAALVAAGALAAVFVWQGARYRETSRGMLPEVESLERLARTGGASGGAGAGAARPASWANLLAALHEAAGHVPLEEFGYVTGEVLEARDASAIRSRIMTAEIEGAADYERITDFVRGLTETRPPLELLRLEISADERRPRFRATVGLATSLPVATPRVVSLDRER